SAIAESLRAAGGDDLDIAIASPGGSVFDGIEIYNAIRDYKRMYPKSQILITLKGLAASMASYIASSDVADMVLAEDNAVFMIHNPWSVMIGDYDDMQKEAEFLSGLASLMANAYSARTKKSKSEIKKMMDAETWLFGDEIKAAGFVDDIIHPAVPDQTPADDKKSAALSTARMKFEAMKAAAAKRADPKADALKAAAMMSILTGSNALTGEKNTHSPESGVNQKEAEMPKTLAEFLAQGEAAVAEVEKLKTDVVVAERLRVKTLNEMRAKYSALGAVAELIDEAIATGKTAEDIALAVADLVLAAAESAKAIDAGTSDTATGESAGPVNDYRPIQIVR
ncbi:Clp protease ClpP, partial [bacterium]|nr:Clp protease ClpP [bacterium]